MGKKTVVNTYDLCLLMALIFKKSKGQMMDSNYSVFTSEGLQYHLKLSAAQTKIMFNITNDKNCFCLK